MGNLELFITDKCNNNCIFCIEGKKITNSFEIASENIINNLIKRNKFYDKVIFLGGEPFLHSEINKILKACKLLKYQVSITTNGTFLKNKKIAQMNLPLINELVVSVHGSNDKIHNLHTNRKVSFANLNLGLNNIRKFFKGNLLKVNCVVTKYNFKDLSNIIDFAEDNSFNELSFTNLTLDQNLENGTNFVVKLDKIKRSVEALIEYSKNKKLIIKFADYPLCVFQLKNIKFSEDFFDRDGIALVSNQNHTSSDEVSIKKDKIKTKKCHACNFKEKCGGLLLGYYNKFGDRELIPYK